MRLFANGCSFTWGGGILEEEHGLQSTLTSAIREEYVELRKSSVWPYYLAELLGCEFDNLSMGCGSNSRIVRTTLDHFSSMITRRETVDDHLAVIQWTEPSRYELFDSSVDDWLLIKTDVVIPSVSDQRYFDLQMRLAEHDANHSTSLFANMVCLSSFFDRWNIKYLFTSFLPICCGSDRDSYCLDHINWATGHPAKSMMEWLPYGEMRYKSGHPTPEGHKLVANMIHARLEELKFL